MVNHYLKSCSEWASSLFSFPQFFFGVSCNILLQNYVLPSPDQTSIFGRPRPIMKLVFPQFIQSFSMAFLPSPYKENVDRIVSHQILYKELESINSTIVGRYYIRVYNQILISKLFFNLNFIYLKLCFNIEPQHILYSLSNLISKVTKFYHLLSTDIDDVLLPSSYRHRLILNSLSLA